MLTKISDVDAFVATRTAWHTVAERVLAPARHAATGRIGLRADREGIFTPPFGPKDRQVRLRVGSLSDVDRDGRRSTALTSLGAAAAFVGVDPGADTGVYTATTSADPATPVAGDPLLETALVAWFAFGSDLLERWRAGHGADAPSEIQLWPEHFDVAVDLGPEGGRANYGASPGDDGHPLPYLYVGPWEPDDDPFWNAGSYARLGHEELAATADPLATGLEFFAAGHAIAARKS